MLERVAHTATLLLLAVAAGLFVLLASSESGNAVRLALVLLALTLCAYALVRLLPPAILAYAALRRRLAVRRVRRAFRDALAAADRHPELVDLAALRAAATALRLAQEGGPLSCPMPEVLAALDHPYGPIRDAARLIIDAPGNSASRTPSGS